MNLLSTTCALIWRLVAVGVSSASFVATLAHAGSKPASPAPVDSSVSAEARNLLRNLHRIGWDPDKIMFGQEFPLSFRSTLPNPDTDLDQSDCKDVVGDHPGVHGSDFHYMINKPLQRPIHIAAARQAYEAGAVVTFDFHWLGKYGGSHNYHPEDAKILDHVVRNDDSRGDVTWFYQHLDLVLEIVNNDLQFPIVFRPLHENNGNWFWWGSKLEGGPETYKRAYQLLVEYMSSRTEHLLYSWSPDKSLALEYYPGNEYVDVIGMDVYGAGTVPWLSIEQMVSLVEQAVDFAAANGKVAAITETGFSSQGGEKYPQAHQDWWMKHHLEPILASPKARHVAWALTWINSSWAGPYLPPADAPEPAKDDFRRYYAHPVTLFQQEVAAERMYDAR